MASPDNSSILGNSFTSSPRPIRAPSDHSPVRHRLSTSTAPSGSPPEDHSRPRLSPTLSRQYNNPLDPQLRERQRTMDADMAIQLSRARSNTVAAPTSSPIIPPVSPISPVPRRTSTDMPSSEPLVFSLQEERDLEAARSGGPPDMTSAIPSPSPGLPPSELHSDMHLNHLSVAHDPGLLVTFQQDIVQDGEGDALGGLPMYQASVGSPVSPERPAYDFDQMEAFAREEKTRLGIQSPGASPFDFRARVPGHGHEQGAEGASLDDAPRTRHRKLSQSTPHPRRGKMALFEQPGGAPPPALAARAPHLLGHYTTPLSAVPSYDQLPGAGQNGYAGSDAVPIPGASTSAAGQGHDRPYRFSFYSNALSATIHARSLSELPAEGQSFEDLFLGRPGSGAATSATMNANASSRGGSYGASPIPGPGSVKSTGLNGRFGNMGTGSQNPENCTWWLDVLSPTDEEMKLLSKVFNIHPLTTEDIQMEETREKIELFRNYYFVCFRGFDQDPYSPTYLEPLNMYIIVFREGILSFHYRPTPHPQNVRRRIKQLKDYISVTSDWISYALIDDITDAFGPLIQGIEYEVDSIDELVLILKDAEQSDMLRRIGTCRKKVMGLLRLMGNKADVVKGLAKRCNENWRVAPTSDIGLYLSDIQDHLITMTQNLNHYEKILSRSHSNYLAQISIEMTEANNQINDVLSKLTALGTVLIPMNLVTGLWGMNVHVPGQFSDGYTWFGAIIGALAAFALIAGYSTYKLMVRR